VSGKNGAGNNDTSGKVGNNGTFSILGFEMGNLGFGFGKI